MWYNCGMKRRKPCEAAAFALAAISACMPLLAAEWIAGDYVRPAEDDTAAFLRECPNDVLRRSFTTKKQPVASAVWKVAAPGMRDLSVNGVRVFVKTLDGADPAAFKSLFRGERQLQTPRYPETGYFTVKDVCPEDDL